MDYNLFLPNESVIDNDVFSIHTTPKLEGFSIDVLKDINDKRQKKLSFFSITVFRKIQINLYDEKGNFVIKKHKNIMGTIYHIILLNI
jgi:hypothetical protein